MLSHLAWPEASKLLKAQCRGQEAQPVEAEGQGSSGPGRGWHRASTAV